MQPQHVVGRITQSPQGGKACFSCEICVYTPSPCGGKRKKNKAVRGMALIIGVDPGSATGGLALMIDGVLTAVADMPIKAFVKRSKGNKLRDIIGGSPSHTHHELDDAAVIAILREWLAGRTGTMFLEEAHGRPRQGLVTTGRLMSAFGALRAIGLALGLEVEVVSPNTWKPALACPATERGACDRAIDLFPHMAKEFKRVRDNHKAEASMIALWGYRHG